MCYPAADADSETTRAENGGSSTEGVHGVHVPPMEQNLRFPAGPGRKPSNSEPRPSEGCSSSLTVVKPQRPSATGSVAAGRRHPRGINRRPFTQPVSGARPAGQRRYTSHSNATVSAPNGNPAQYRCAGGVSLGGGVSGAFRWPARLPAGFFSHCPLIRLTNPPAGGAQLCGHGRGGRTEPRPAGMSQRIMSLSGLE